MNIKKYVPFHSQIWNLLTMSRFKQMSRLINYPNITDIGARDGGFGKYLKDKNYEWFDINSTNYANVEFLDFKDDSKEVVICCEVLEHTFNPIRAIKELRRVYQKQLIISVPNEPIFSLFSLGWDNTHLWTITPDILKHYLGKPKKELKTFLHLNYIAVWEKEK